MSDTFPARLRSVRELRGWTQAELAQRAGLPPTSISHFEGGTRKPSFDNLRRLSKALDVQTDYLLGVVDSADATSSASRIARHLSNASESEIAAVERFAEMLAEQQKRK